MAIIKHGLTLNGKKHPIYKLRERMIYYCHAVPETREGIYGRYRGRGIIVCDEWRDDVMSFYDWCMNNGWQKGLQLDRIDNNGNYEPNNCQFLNRAQHQAKTSRESPVMGERIGTSVLTDIKVRAIKLLLRDGCSSTKIAEFFNVGTTTIKYIGCGKTWKHIKE